MIAENVRAMQELIKLALADSGPLVLSAWENLNLSVPWGGGGGRPGEHQSSARKTVLSKTVFSNMSYVDIL